MLERLWRRHRSNLDHVDLAVALALSLVFTVLGLLDAASGDALSQAAIALLALLAFSLLRERFARERVVTGLAQVQDGMQTTVNEIKRSVEELESDHPYHTRSLELRYDLMSTHGSRAQATKTREIRFTRSNVISISDHHNADGDLDQHTIEGGPKNGHKIDLPRVRELRDDRGRPIDLVSLERPRKHGEVMEIVSHRLLIDSFPDAREYVNLDVESPTDQVTFHVTWPADSPPRGLELSRRGARANGNAIALSRLQKDAAGRSLLVETVSDPRVGESITLFWDW